MAPAVLAISVRRRPRIAPENTCRAWPPWEERLRGLKKAPQRLRSRPVVAGVTHGMQRRAWAAAAGHTRESGRRPWWASCLPAPAPTRAGDDQISEGDRRHLRVRALE